MLQSEGAARRNSWQGCITDHCLTVEKNGDALAAHPNEKSVPLAKGFVGANFRSHRRADFVRQRFVLPIIPHLPGADGPAPDVDLSLADAADVDAAVSRVGNFDRFARAVVVARIA